MFVMNVFGNLCLSGYFSNTYIFFYFILFFFLTHPAKFRPKMTSGRKPAAAGKTPGKPNAFKVSGL